MIRDTLANFIKDFRPDKLGADERIELALTNFGAKLFSRKKYIDFHKTLSTAQASRDLKLAVEKGLIYSNGEKALTKYRKTGK